MAAVHPLPSPSDEIPAYLAELAREGKSPVTISGYAHDLADFARWYHKTTGDLMTTALCTPHDLADYKSYLRVTKRLAAATVNRRLAALRSFFRWAQAAGQITEVPTAKIKPVRATKAAPQALERKAVNRLLREVERAAKPRDVAIITLLLHTGLRVAELCDLRLGDVTRGVRKGHLHVHAGKGDRSRDIPLNSDACDAVRGYLNVRPVSVDGHLFLGQTGKGISHDGLQYLVKRYGDKAGIEGLHPHCLRHTFARSLLAKGEDISKVQALLGHESIVTTSRYTMASQDDLAAAVSKLETDW